jgi:cell division protease FtsH
MERTRFFRRPVVWIILVIIGAIALSSFFTSGPSYQRVDTSVALERLNQPGIVQVLLKDKEQTLQIDLAADERFAGADEATKKIETQYPYEITPQIWSAVQQAKSAGRIEKTVNATVSGDSILLSLLLNLLPIAILVILLLLFMSQMQGGGSRVLNFGKSKAKMVSKDMPKTTFADVAGADEAVEELHEIKDFLQNPAKYQALGAKIPKGVLLYGPPGTGKTLLAKAVAQESGAAFFSQSASSFVEMFAGLGAARIRRLFRIARKAAPAIIFIDELDAVGATRGKDISGEKDQTLNQLLVELDGFAATDNIVVIAASNLLEKLDSALLRPGRFDRQIFVTPPDLKGRRSILGVHTRDKPLTENVDLEIIARQTSGLTGADLANLCNEAAIFAGRDHRTQIGTKDFQAALERVIAGVQSRRVISEHEKRVVAYHEAGHALCSELLESVEKVHRISIIPRGKALGYTLNLPEEDRYLKTKDELLDYMIVLLGGRVTEHIVFGEVTTGASDDLRKVHEISRSMVTQYGMGTELISKQLPADDYAMSDHTRRMVDEEQQYLTDLAHRRALKLVAEHRTLLEAFAFMLLENEVLEREDIERLVAAYRGKSGALAGSLPIKSLEPGPAEVAAAEGERREARD